MSRLQAKILIRRRRSPGAYYGYNLSITKVLVIGKVNNNHNWWNVLPSRIHIFGVNLPGCKFIGGSVYGTHHRCSNKKIDLSIHNLYPTSTTANSQQIRPTMLFIVVLLWHLFIAPAVHWASHRLPMVLGMAWSVSLSCPVTTTHIWLGS